MIRSESSGSTDQMMFGGITAESRVQRQFQAQGIISCFCVFDRK